MATRDPFDDDDFYEDEPSAASLATALPDTPNEQRTPAKHALDKEMEADQRDAIRDMALWSEAVPESAHQARFLGNLTNRLLRGIPRKTIDTMTVRDRVTAARQCYDMRQLELSRPTMNINFTQRREMMDMLPALKAEMERREREAMTVDITPEQEGD